MTQQRSPFRYTVGSVLYLGSHYLQNARFGRVDTNPAGLSYCEEQTGAQGITGFVVDNQVAAPAEVWTTTSPKPSDPLTIYRRAI